jgi:hypothetical protein
MNTITIGEGRMVNGKRRQDITINYRFIGNLIEHDRVGSRSLIDRETSHTTVRTVRYTAVPKFTVSRIRIDFH